MKKSLPAWFRRLSWKLTLNYALITMSALLLVELVLAGGAIGYILLFTGSAAGAVADPVFALAADASPFWESDPPDLRGLENWLRDSAREIPGPSAEPRTDLQLPHDVSISPTGRLYFLDLQGAVLYAFPPGGGDIPEEFLKDAGSLIQAAGQGQLDRSQLVDFSLLTGRLIVAAPIRDAGGMVRGVMVYTDSQGAGASGLLEIAQLIGLSLLCIGPAAVGIGSIFGFFTARGLTRRLSRMAETAGDWGRGDFSILIDDRSQDEIGQLAGELNRMSAQLQELIGARQRLAGLEERNRIARDLHDSVKQQVFAVSMQLGAAQAVQESDPDQGRRRIDSAMQLARQAQQELTALIRTLRPAPLEGKGLTDALADHLAGWRAQSGIGAALTATGEADLPAAVEQALFRVAQEALTNIARHSRATDAKVDLQIGPSAVVLTVADDGHGFDAGAEHSGLGLRSMRERMQSVGGELAIASSAMGTVLTAKAAWKEE